MNSCSLTLPLSNVHGDEAVLAVFLIGFITVLFSTPIEHREAALIILRESVDGMTRLADMLLFNTSTLSMIISIIINHHKDQY